MNRTLSKSELLAVAIGLPILIYATQNWHIRYGMAVIFLAAGAAVISFAVAVFRWWVKR